MTPEQARENFSAAFDDELGESRAAFDALLAEDAELREEYAEFVSLLKETQALALDEDVPEAGGAPPPDLLAGVQKKLRQRSGGRFYRDRFSERSTRGLSLPMVIAAVMLVLLVTAFLLLNWTTVLDAPSSAPESGAAQDSAPR